MLRTELSETQGQCKTLRGVGSEMGRDRTSGNTLGFAVRWRRDSGRGGAFVYN